MRTLECDVCVIGGGSGGIGAAIGAASRGASTILVERSQALGGTVSMAWVHTWEPVCGSSKLCRRIWDAMTAMPLGASKELDYSLSCKRLGKDGLRNPPLPFEPWAFQKAVGDELAKAGVKTLLGANFVSSSKDGRALKSIRAAHLGGALEIKARVFIDSTADINVAREAGCAFAKGSEAKATYGEPHAPEKADPSDLNAMNWCYRVRDGREKLAEISGDEFEPEHERPRRFEVAMPNGDVLVNTCGLVSADPDDPEAFSKAVEKAWSLALGIHRWSVARGGCQGRELIGVAPQIGARESYRLLGRSVLTESDILAGKNGKDCVCSCDHPLDIHGASHLHIELERPYGAPFGCLQTQEFDNLLVACRGASFSHIAAASCRLSRTMTTLGEAAGAAAAEAVKAGKLVEDVETPALDLEG